MATLTGDRSSHPISNFSDGMSGTCLCGSITLTITQPGLFDKPNGHTCHCKNCRAMTGGSHANLLMLPASNLTVSDPKKFLKTYLDFDSASGRVVPRSFCSNCGSGLGTMKADGVEKPEGKEWGGPPEGFAIIGLGLFPRIPVPELELFTAHRQEWVQPIEGAKQNKFLFE